jgi:hypothetical protein
MIIGRSINYHLSRDVWSDCSDADMSSGLPKEIFSYICQKCRVWYVDLIGFTTSKLELRFQ